MLDILTIFGGLILCVGILDAIPAMGKSLEKFAKWLGFPDIDWSNHYNISDT